MMFSIRRLELGLGKSTGKLTCIAPIVSISTTKRSDVDHTELPANTPHLPFLRISIRYRATLLLTVSSI